jgi:peptidoglycan/LPS O-acetylase OafA/YrhL
MNPELQNTNASAGSVTKDLNRRLSELDFLRGVAVILVLFGHHWINDYLQHAGWVGVDLFFVLSGFLVSGLLFSEYKKFGDVRPFHFLIRRGFKIYPLFYLSLLITAAYLIGFDTTFDGIGKVRVMLREVLFLQNYFGAFWWHHWSLAVEEHFYVFLCILVFVLTSKKILQSPRIFISISVAIAVGCLILRILTNIYYPENSFRNYAATHLRIDSLFAGVTISYLYHFQLTFLEAFYRNYRIVFFCLIFIPLTFVPFTDPIDSFFIKTLGFTLIYIAFGSLLMVFLFSSRVNRCLQRALTKQGYAAICGIGFYSYSTYLFHPYMLKFVVGEYYSADLPGTRVLTATTVGSFLVFFTGSIFLGVVSSKLIEIPFLKLREKYFPRRVSNI